MYLPVPHIVRLRWSGSSEDAAYGTMKAVTTRQPRWVYDEGDEPDPRFSLANERTFLAWVRTALAMFAGGVALHALEVPSTDWLRTLLVVVLLGLGGLICLFSLVRWARVERAMRLRQPLPSFGLGIVMAVALALVALLLVIVLL
jgi:putative membrane protein